MKEIWKRVLKGFYEVSTLGRVRRSDTGHYLSLKIIQRYAVVSLYVKGTKHHWLVHRLVAHAFLGPCPKGKEVNHKNGDRADNTIRNLEYLTPAQNKRHAVEMGLSCRGETSGMARLTDKQVIQIRKEYKKRGDCGRLAKKFKVHLATVDYIVRRKTWRHL